MLRTIQILALVVGLALGSWSWFVLRNWGDDRGMNDLASQDAVACLVLLTAAGQIEVYRKRRSVRPIIATALTLGSWLALVWGLLFHHPWLVGVGVGATALCVTLAIREWRQRTAVRQSPAV